MTPDEITWLGLIAGTIGTVALVPQLVKIWKTKSARDLSMTTLALFQMGNILWFSYGFFSASSPLMIFASLTFAINCGIIALKIKFNHDVELHLKKKTRQNRS